MGLDDKIQQTRAIRRAADEANRRAVETERSRALQNKVEGDAALLELGRSAAAVLESAGAPMFPELAKVKSVIFSGYTVKVLKGRLWILGQGNLGLSRDGVFHLATTVWRLQQGFAANQILTPPHEQNTGSHLLYTENSRRTFEARAQKLAQKRGFPGGYSRARTTATSGCRPNPGNDYNVFGLYMDRGTLMYGNTSEQTPYEDMIAGYLETLLP